MKKEQGHWAINYTPMLSVHDMGFKLSAERFHSAADAFNFMELNGIDHMEVMVEYVSYFYQDCDLGTCAVCQDR